MNVLTQISLISLIFMGLFLPRTISFRSVVVVVVVVGIFLRQQNRERFSASAGSGHFSLLLSYSINTIESSPWCFHSILRPHFRCCKFRAKTSYSSNMQDEGNDNNQVENAVNWRAVRSLHSLYCIQYHNDILSRDESKYWQCDNCRNRKVFLSISRLKIPLN